MKSGFVAVVGRTNVGKSTLLNSILNVKLSATSSKSQTTRTLIRGVATYTVEDEPTQVVFVDTPGIHKPKRAIGTITNKAAYDGAQDCDLILFVIDNKKGFTEGDKKIYNNILKLNKPLILVLNKIDKSSNELILKNLQEVSANTNFIDYVPVSARSGKGVEILKKVISDNLPEGPQYYDEKDQVLVTLSNYVAEIVREKYLWKMNQEIPHSILVKVWSEDEQTAEKLNLFLKEITGKKDTLRLNVNVFVERDSQKGIVIGSKGKVLKEVGTLAREELEQFFGCKVVLKTKISVEKDWQSNEDLINSHLE